MLQEPRQNRKKCVMLLRGGSPEERPHDVSRGQNRYATLSLNNYILDEVFVICRIIDVEALIILHITKTESNNCFIIHFKWRKP